MRSLEDFRAQSVLNTKPSQSGFTHWKKKFRRFAVAKKSSQSVSAERKRRWNQEPLKDIFQDEARQPYRSREKDTTSATDMRTQKGKAKKTPREEGGE
jgi:hypothetical protein